MARSITIYRSAADGEVQKIPVRCAPTDRPSDLERVMHEGSQGDRVLRGYRDLESAGRLDPRKMKDSPATIKRAWSDEVSARFK